MLSAIMLSILACYYHISDRGQGRAGRVRWPLSTPTHLFLYQAEDQLTNVALDIPTVWLWSTQGYNQQQLHHYNNTTTTRNLLSQSVGSHQFKHVNTQTELGPGPSLASTLCGRFLPSDSWASLRWHLQVWDPQQWAQVGQTISGMWGEIIIARPVLTSIPWFHFLTIISFKLHWVCGFSSIRLYNINICSEW